MNDRVANAPAESRTLFDRFREVGRAPDLVAETDRRLARRHRRRRQAAQLALAAVVVGGTLFWAVPYYRDTATLTTPAAERRSLALADGSRAELNARTELRVDFRDGRRLVRLDHGEVFLAVASNPRRPFVVETPEGSIQVTGTRFNVRVPRGGPAEVTLIEGAVTLRPAEVAAGAAVGLAPGEQAALGGGAPTPRALTAAQLEQALAWRQGRLVLDDLTLAEAAARLAEFHGREIKVDPAVAGLRLGGAYSLDDLPQFFAALQGTETVSVLTVGDGTFRIVGR